MAGRVLSINTDLPEEETVTAVSSVIVSGGIVIYPSDTVYGILADSHNRKACEEVAEIKGYPAIRPFIILVPTVESALSLIDMEEKLTAKQLMQQHWPGPVTLVFKADTAVPVWLVSSGGTIAVRQPADRLSQAVLGKTGKFLVTTSANTRGQSFPLSLQQINYSLKNSVDLILDAGQLPLCKPSRVLDCTGTILVEIRK